MKAKKAHLPRGVGFEGTFAKYLGQPSEVDVPIDVGGEES